MNGTLILSAKDISDMLDISELLAAVDASFRQTSAAEAQVPLRIKLQLTNTNNRLIVMPAHLPRLKALATKVLTVFPGNGKLGSPLIQGVVILNDVDTGAPLAVMDGGVVTTLRTAAASAVATRALARPETRTLGLIGAGAEGKAHLRIFARLYDLVDVRICGRELDSARHLADQAAPWVKGSVRAVATPEEATRGADLVITATTATQPVVKGEWLGDGSHVCAVGAATRTHRELDSNVLNRATIVAVDTREGALAEAGDLITPISEGRLSEDKIVEVGEILLARSPGRTTQGEITVYKGVGMAAMDAAVASCIYTRARERGVGTEVIFGEARL